VRGADRATAVGFATPSELSRCSRESKKRASAVCESESVSLRKSTVVVVSAKARAPPRSLPSNRARFAACDEQETCACSSLRPSCALADPPSARRADPPHLPPPRPLGSLPHPRPVRLHTHFHGASLLPPARLTMSSTLRDIVNSIFEPGTNQGLLRAMNASFYALFATLAALLVATRGNVHVVALLTLSVALWASIKWCVLALASLARALARSQLTRGTTRLAQVPGTDCQRRGGAARGATRQGAGRSRAGRRCGSAFAGRQGGQDGVSGLARGPLSASFYRVRPRAAEADSPACARAASPRPPSLADLARSRSTPAALRHPARAPEHVAIPLFPATQSDTHAKPLAFSDEVEEDEDERCSSFTTEQRGGGYYEEARGEEGDRESATASWPLCQTTPSSALPSSRRRQRLRARKRLQHLCALG